MKDKGLDFGSIITHDTSKAGGRKQFFGFRKMFWDYLKKLNVPFADACCPNASQSAPVRLNTVSGELEYFDGSEWLAVDGFVAPTTTTTTTAPATTTTTTAAPTTTTTTTVV